jgi:hypothetical protein
MFNANEYNKAYKKKHATEIAEYNKSYYAKNKERLLFDKKSWRKNNMEKAKTQDKVKYYSDPQKAQERSIKWRKKNNDKYKDSSKKSDKKRRSTIKGRLNINIGNAIRFSLRTGKNNHHWESLVVFTVQELKQHLEKLFKSGMTWGNYGQWHIDHKIPISVFNFNSPEDIDFKRCWALSNLQPLWAPDNIRKFNKLTKPFQPSLTMTI